MLISSVGILVNYVIKFNQIVAKKKLTTDFPSQPAERTWNYFSFLRATVADYSPSRSPWISTIIFNFEIMFHKYVDRAERNIVCAQTTAKTQRARRICESKWRSIAQKRREKKEDWTVGVLAGSIAYFVSEHRPKQRRMMIFRFHFSLPLRD